MAEDGHHIPITRPSFGEREVAAAGRSILSGWVTQGPEVAAFEREFAEMVGAEHACAVSNCTTALHLALLACGVRPGDEVITASHSFIATGNVVRYCDAVPVFVDIRPDSFNMDPCRVEEAVSERTRAILCVHQIGMPCDLSAILAIARRYALPVIEDAACATGSEICWKGRWEPIGRPHGDIACFSFHPRKVVSTGDGGMITTSNGDWDGQFRLLRQHGMSVPDTVRHGAREVVFESYPVVGYNYRMTDIQAAIGREQLKRLPDLLARRRALADRYRVLLAEIPGLRSPEEPSWARSNWQSYCVRLPDNCDQRPIMQYLLDRGIATRRGVMSSHREPAYAHEPWSCGVATCSGRGGSCPHLRESERASDGCIIIPLFPQMSEAEQDRVVETLAKACAGRCDG